MAENLRLRSLLSDSSVDAMAERIAVNKAGDYPAGARGTARHPSDFSRSSGADPSRPIDGRSLLSLVREEGRGWREWIDLEHNICYSPANHWNALTDGRWKYIFHARDGEQQLFDLRKDPLELHDLASDTRHQDMLRKWRGRLTDYLSERGDEFVKRGQLALRPQGRMTSPNFPAYGAATPANG